MLAKSDTKIREADARVDAYMGIGRRRCQECGVFSVEQILRLWLGYTKLVLRVPSLPTNMMAAAYTGCSITNIMHTTALLHLVRGSLAVVHFCKRSCS